MVKREDIKLMNDRLWADHFWYTEIVILDAISNSPCLGVHLEALMENQDNLGDLFAKVTGNRRAGEELTSALKEHINIAVELVQAAIAKKDTKEIYKRWQQNADVVSEIYHKYNRRIPLLSMKRMMQQHLETTLAEAVGYISGDCTAGYEAGEKALDHVRMMAQFLNNAM